MTTQQEITHEELHEILEFYKSGYKSQYANKDIERLVNEIFRLKNLLKNNDQPKKIKKIKKV